ncbi:MAG TPA: DUF4388 domain-containing protein [Vicinamibacteria bacterium]|nr:DUF4388 domain-containing protein [Vicinamibacteria bacterium]
MPTSRWFYVQQDERRGPVDLEVLVDMLATRQLPEVALVWRHGLKEWVPAAQVPEVADQLPPPVPAVARSAAAPPQPPPAAPDFARKAEQLRAEGEPTQAIRICREGLALTPDHTLGQMTLGRALMDKGELAAARDEFKAVLRATPANILAERLMHECTRRLERAASTAPAPAERVVTPEAHAAASRARAKPVEPAAVPAGMDTSASGAEFWPARSLAESDVPDVVQALHEIHWTGVLSLHHMGVAKTVAVKDGRLVFASSSSRDDRLGELLLRRGKITLTQYIEAGRAVGKGKRLGTILVEMGALPANELVRAVVEHTQEIIYSVFQWTEGFYRLKEGADTGSEAITLKLGTADIILEGIRRIESWTRIERGVGGMDARYERAPNYEALLKHVNLSVDKLALATGHEGVRDVEAICKQSTLSHFEVCRTLWAFRVIGVMRRLPAA